MQIVEKVLRSVVKKYEPASTSNEPFPLVNVIAGIHLAHSLIEREMSWFAELSENFPELPSLLIKRQLLSSDKIVRSYLVIKKYVYRCFILKLLNV